MQKSQKIRLVRSALGHEDRAKGVELVFFCPKHQHHKPKLSVSVETDRFHCWFCGWGGKTLLGLREMGGDAQLWGEYAQSIKEEGPPARASRIYDTPVLPREFRSLTREWNSPFAVEAYRYLMERYVTDSDIARWRLGYCEDGEYRHRIIVPSFDADGELNFFVGRAYRKNVGLSYKHGNFDKDVIWNDLMIDWNLPLTVVEGPFDAFKAYHNVTALQGTIMGDRLFSRIAAGDQSVYFALDGDALKKQYRMVERLLFYGISCFIIPLGDRKDPGSMSRAEFSHMKEQAIPISSDIDLLKMRVRDI